MRRCIRARNCYRCYAIYTATLQFCADRHARRTPDCLIDCLHTLRAPVPRTQTGRPRFAWTLGLYVLDLLVIPRRWRWAKLTVGERDRRLNPEGRLCETARNRNEKGSMGGNNVEAAIGKVKSIGEICTMLWIDYGVNKLEYQCRISPRWFIFFDK